MACLLALGWESWFLIPPYRVCRREFWAFLQQISVPRSSGRALWTEILRLGGRCPCMRTRVCDLQKEGEEVAHSNPVLPHSVWRLTINDAFLGINIILGRSGTTSSRSGCCYLKHIAFQRVVEQSENLSLGEHLRAGELRRKSWKNKHSEPQTTKHIQTHSQSS